jgi:hypothetical protein
MQYVLRVNWQTIGRLMGNLANRQKLQKGGSKNSQNGQHILQMRADARSLFFKLK